MEKALPCHELCQEKENEAFPHAPLEAVPVKKAGDSEGKIVNENEEQEKMVPKSTSRFRVSRHLPTKA